jgi:indole-3-glycerol phosphate synthase
MILAKIIDNKRSEIAALKKKTPINLLRRQIASSGRSRPRFFKALCAAKPLAVIAEIKRKSPSKGILRADFDPVRIAREYERGGAAALSVLTDQKFFGGSPDVLKSVREATVLPLLRKDFILEEYQIWESKSMGADAILLIAGLLPVPKLKAFRLLALKLGMDALVEVHTGKELKDAIRAGATIIGINNRDLRTFRVNIETTRDLARFVPKKVFLVSESGIQNHQDLTAVRGWGAKAVLVGEGLMRSRNPGQALRKLLGKKALAS